MIIDFLISKIEQLQFVDYEYMAVFLLLVFLVKKSLTGGKSSQVLILQDTSKLLKALCCIIIVVHHDALRMEGGGICKLLGMGGGTFSLTIFLLLSSYGITKSEMAKPTTYRQYLSKRVVKLLVPYFIVTIGAIALYWFIGANASEAALEKARINASFVELGQHRSSFGDIMSYLFGIKMFCFPMWFVGVTLYSYMVFMFIKRFLNHRILMLTLYACSLLIFTKATYLFGFPICTRLNLWSLFVGMCLALYEKELRAHGTIWKVGCYLLANLFVVLWTRYTHIIDPIYMAFANLAVISIFLFNEMFKRVSLIKGSLISGLSLISYEIYLVHTHILTIEWWYFGLISVVLSLCAIVMFAIMVKRITPHLMYK